MKINLLRMIIIATAFNSLQIHGMYPSQQLALQAQQYHQAQIQQQQPQHNYNTVVTTTSTTTNKPASLTINNPTEKKYTAIAMDNNGCNRTDPIFTEEEDNEAILLIEKINPTGINCLMEKNILLMGCCDDYNIVCTKTKAAKILCGVCCCLTSFIVIAIAAAGKL